MSMPEASGSLKEMMDRPFFEPLYELYRTYGGIFKLSFGPQTFVVVSDPRMMRQILATSADKFSKGILSDILEFVMGNGLIPANGDIWLERRRAIVPSMHKAFLENMIQTFAACTDRGLTVIADSVAQKKSLEVEGFFSRLALDIIGHAVFDFDFDATTHNDPVIKAVYTVLREAEYRSLAPIPWWKIPSVDMFVPQQRRVRDALMVINQTLDRLVQSVQDMLNDEQDNLDTSKLSILHFLLASREVVSAQQLRDDLMTLLIAGHETTAAVLTWTFYELSKRPDIVAAMQEEIDRVIGEEPVTSSSLLQLDLCTRVIAESMRLYPQPPVLIRRALESVRVGEYVVPEGTDIFLSVWNLHRSPSLWKNPLLFDPDRFPKNSGMPSEISTDFGYLPFGGGRRKCIGAQFALLESLNIVSSILRKYDFTMASDAPDVELTTGATIHSTNGLHLQFTERAQRPPSQHPEIPIEMPKTGKCPYHR